MKRNATAVWNGTITEGQGQISTQSKTLSQSQYSFKTRFADGVGTNPEELLAAAHAGCYSMKLSLDLTEAGFKPQQIETVCEITLENGVISKSALSVKASVDGIDEQNFMKIAEEAKLGCPVSKAFSLDITLSAQLLN